MERSVGHVKIVYLRENMNHIFTVAVFSEGTLAVKLMKAGFHLTALLSRLSWC